MTVEELALEFREFRGTVSTDIANMKNDIHILRKVKFSNGWKNRTVFTGVGALLGGGILETLHKIMEHVK